MRGLAHNVTMRRRWGLLPFLAAVATAQQASPGPGVNFYSVEKEVALGRQLAAEFQRNAKLLASPATQTFIDDLGERLAAHAPNSAFTYTFRLIAEDPTVLHEPAAFPGGFVFVPARLILAAKDEGELAGMLAHAIAHVAARHGTQQASRAEILHTIPVVYVGSAAGSAIPRDNTLVLPMKLRAKSRAYELEADRLAVGIMSAAGYDPAAFVRYVEREQPSDEATPEAFVSSSAADRALERAPLRDQESAASRLRTASRFRGDPSGSTPPHRAMTQVRSADWKSRTGHPDAAARCAPGRSRAASPPVHPPLSLREGPNAGGRADALRAGGADGIAEAGRLFEAAAAKMGREESGDERIAGPGRVLHVDIESRGEDLAAAP